MVRRGISWTPNTEYLASSNCSAHLEKLIGLDTDFKMIRFQLLFLISAAISVAAKTDFLTFAVLGVVSLCPGLTDVFFGVRC